MKKFFRILLLTGLAAMLVGTFYFLWRKTQPKIVRYEILAPKVDTIRQYVVATGKIEPRDEVLIKPQISGIVSEVRCQAGDMVRKNDILATVKVIPEMGSLNSAESRVNVARINLDEIEKQHARTRSLYEKGVVSLEEFDKSRAELDRAREEVTNAQDNLEIVRNGITSRYREMSNTQVRSTIDGMVLDVPIKVGNSVIQANTFNDGTTIATIADMGDMLFRGNVDETDVGRIRPGMEVDLAIGAMQDVLLKAELEYISPKAAEQNGVVMFEVKAAAEIPDSLFVRSGYSANATILIENREGVLALPESALVYENEEPGVEILTSDEQAAEQTFERRAVKVGLSNGIMIEITDGVGPDDRVRGNRIEE